MQVITSQIKSSLEEIRRRIHQAQAVFSSHFDTAIGVQREVRLIAVSKKHSIDAIQAAYACGQRDFGENYVHELVEKVHQAKERGLDDIRWHFIGQLQRNKVRKLLDCRPTLVHSVDRFSLARQIQRVAEEKNITQDVLVECRIGKEDKLKSGVEPEKLDEFVFSLQSLTHLKLRGLMLIPVYGQAVAQRRADYQQLDMMAQRIGRSARYRQRHMERSMGMSDDFELAVEQGSTMVRIGRAIFGERS